MHQAKKNYNATVRALKKYKRILFLTTSSRWIGEGGEKPKSTRLAYMMQREPGLEKKVTIIEVPTLKIYPCEGNVSTDRGNRCGLMSAQLKDKRKNPTGYHRCYASLNNPDDELWKISRELFKSDAVVIFGSIRWGQANAEFQKLIERLTWIENRTSTYGEPSIVKNIAAGAIFVGQNWRGREVLETEHRVLEFFGFKTPKALSWNWQFLTDSEMETNQSYLDGVAAFNETFLAKKVPTLRRKRG